LSSSESAPRYHFVGVGGSGMSALAEYHARRGGKASGSDRAFDRGERPDVRRALEAVGVAISPQDGSGVPADCDAVIVSTAVETTIPDVRRARDLGLPILHRSELLARFVAERRTIAVTGTSGKSTTVAMIFTILDHAGRGPSLITGGPLVALRERGATGSAWAGDGKLLVIEADESDGSLVHYAPWCAVVLNLQRDHREPEEVARDLAVFLERTTGPRLVGDGQRLDALAGGAVRFGLRSGTRWRPEGVRLRPDGATFTLDGVAFSLPVPGRHNVLNAAAAVAAAAAAGVSLEEAAEALRGFGGVARRFQVVGQAAGVTVVDDFAHNPDKIRAAVAAARLRADGGRILAVFQPHGFGPTRFLLDDLVAAFREALLPGDVLWLAPIYYAGGSVTRDVSSADLAAPLAADGRDARVVADRLQLPSLVAAEARGGDVVLVMGARDPTLSDLAREILASLAAGSGSGPE